MRSIVCFVFLSLIYQTIATSQSELSALSGLYYATDGDNWVNNTNWFVGDPCASADFVWYGVSCENNHVVALYLSENGLYGSIPDSLIDLYNLDTISLFDNDIFGSIPSNWNSLRALVKIDLKGNALSGPIPASLGDLLGFNLDYLDLSENTLGGVLPSFFNNAASYFVFIDLSNNEFVCPIPSSAAYTKATCINVIIEGSQPTCVGDIQPFLLFGSNFGSLTDISCVYTDSITGSQVASPAISISDNFIQCGLSYKDFSACDGSVGNRLYEMVTVSLSSQGSIISGNSSVEIGVLNPYCAEGLTIINSIHYKIPSTNSVTELCSATKNLTPFTCGVSITTSSTYMYATIDADCKTTSNNTCIWLPATDQSTHNNLCPLYRCHTGYSCVYTYLCNTLSGYANTCYSNPNTCSTNC